MAIRTINSPGVSILERDLSLRVPTNVGTNVFIPGFANSGPLDEVTMISSREELETIYGTPTNSAERYFYYTVRELLNSPATIYTFRLPYGAGSGAGFGTEHSALVYPVRTFVPSTSAVTTSLDLSAATYVLGQPVHVSLTEGQYRAALEGTLFDWSSVAASSAQLNSVGELGKAGVIVLDKAQTTINSQFEGYYVGLADNTNLNPATNFDAITRANTLSLTSNFVGLSGGLTYTQIPNGTLQFNLSSTPNGASNSISQIMENLTDYNIDGREDDDVLSLGVFRLRKSIYATESFKLDFVVDDAIVGSIDSFRTELNPRGGPSIPFFLEARDTNSRNVEILVNPYISNKFTTSSQDEAGLPRKKVRVLTQSLVNNSVGNFASYGVTTGALTAIANQIGYADALYPLGSFTPVNITQKEIGNLPTKINRALESVKNDEIYDIDVVVEAGLGTVFVGAEFRNEFQGENFFDDSYYSQQLGIEIDNYLRTSGSYQGGDSLDFRGAYSSIFNQFENFCNLPSNTGGRGDCIFIADPLRYIFITGKNNKILSNKDNNFQRDIYWAMRHQFELENTSYAATYGNWVKVYEEFTGEMIWQPFSGFAAAVMARSDAAEFPWSAPAGFNRGLLTTSALDLAFNPNQKQRDEMYKININPVMFSPAQGMVVFGQKTLSRKPSAFDRINVRRLFLALERPTKKAAAYFVFEPNNTFTQTRFRNTLTPLFEFAKQNGGVYDYLLICDERNNPAEVIDNNELRCDVYIKSVRTSEFILISFISTRTDTSFEEII